MYKLGRSVRPGSKHYQTTIFPAGTAGMSQICQQPLVVTVADDVKTEVNAPMAFGRRQAFQETKALREAAHKGKTQYEQLQSRLQYAALRHSRDDFLVLFGNRCERYRREHKAASSWADRPEEGFATAPASRYKPLGVKRRPIQTRMQDLVRSMKYPPTQAGDLRKKRHAKPSARAPQAPSPDSPPQTDEAGPPDDPPSDYDLGRAPESPGPAADPQPKKTGNGHVAAALEKLFKVAEAAGSASNAFDELDRRRAKQREDVRAAVKRAAEVRTAAAAAEGDGVPKTKGGGGGAAVFSSEMFLQCFAFPKAELVRSRQRLDRLKKGATHVQRLAANGTHDELFPTPALLDPTGRRTSPAGKAGAADSSTGRPADNDVAVSLNSEVGAVPPDNDRAAAADDDDGPPSDSGSEGASSSSAASDVPVVTNRRLKAVEEFEPNAKPSPRVHRDVLGRDVAVSGYTTSFWNFRFLKGQFTGHANLRTKLEQRRRNCGAIYKSATSLAALTETASRRAVLWGVSGGGSSQTMSSTATDLWTSAVQHKDQHAAAVARKASLYKRVLYYCDLLAAPKTDACLSFLNSLRALLIASAKRPSTAGAKRLSPTGRCTPPAGSPSAGAKGNRALYARLLALVTREQAGDSDVSKILQFVRGELDSAGDTTATGDGA
ncbi:hypothetical protein DIPPA_06799 [Diplonema papillatum]|nr:hypothetical protein DIPPA_06799 [Diplonema papillatum]